MRPFLPDMGRRAPVRERGRVGSDPRPPTPSEVFTQIGVLLAIALGLALAAQILLSISDPWTMSPNGRRLDGWPVHLATGCTSFGRGGAICNASGGSLRDQGATRNTDDGCVSFGKGGRYCPPATGHGKEVQQ